MNTFTERLAELVQEAVMEYYDERDWSYTERKIIDDTDKILEQMAEDFFNKYFDNSFKTVTHSC